MVLTADVPTFERPIGRDAELRGSADVVRFLELPERRAVMIDCSGAAGSEAFAPRMPGLYATAYTLRFGLKDRGVATRVGPLEGLWWMADGSTDLADVFRTGTDHSSWRWTLLIGLPDEATDDEIDRAVAAGRMKLESPDAASLRVARFDEGRVAQLLHVGPYATEQSSIERLHASVAAAGMRLRGRHHEVYLGDPRRSRPERLRTILRHPVDLGMPAALGEPRAAGPGGAGGVDRSDRARLRAEGFGVDRARGRRPAQASTARG